jgi:hypothetical protein
MRRAGASVADFGALFRAKSCDYQTNQSHCRGKYKTSPPYDFYSSFERITGPNFHVKNVGDLTSLGISATSPSIRPIRVHNFM